MITYTMYIAHAIYTTVYSFEISSSDKKYEALGI